MNNVNPTGADSKGVVSCTVKCSGVCFYCGLSPLPGDEAIGATAGAISGAAGWTY